MPVIYQTYQSQFANRSGKKLYYPRVVLTGSVGTDQIAREISELSSLTTGDVKNVIDNLVTVVTRHLQASESVMLDGFGSFRPTVGSKGVANEEDFDAATMMRTPKIVFTPHADLRETYNKVVYERISNKKKEESSEPSTEPDE